MYLCETVFLGAGDRMIRLMTFILDWEFDTLKLLTLESGIRLTFVQVSGFVDARARGVEGGGDFSFV